MEEIGVNNSALFIPSSAVSTNVIITVILTVKESIEDINTISAKVTSDISHVVCDSAILMLYPDKSVIILAQFAGLRPLLNARLTCMILQLSVLCFEFSVACLKLSYLFK